MTMYDFKEDGDRRNRDKFLVSEKTGMKTIGVETVGEKGHTNRAMKSADQHAKRKCGENKIPSCPYPLFHFKRNKSVIVERCLRRAGLNEPVTEIEMSPNTLKRQLVCSRLYDRLCTMKNFKTCPNGRDGNCMRSDMYSSFGKKKHYYTIKKDMNSIEDDESEPVRCCQLHHRSTMRGRIASLA
ncbi:hypothetical protein KIN20_034201 [Parelaphostrongylus tenuis]|uniref:Uncharacterized protein n=1 Tax=Parelaphostrongylus tenuis TaxID=148309 RepID=A0AAD5WIU9_PARTN|nr:hypothetical protein KIN20_034201 [Parelaphostrongylus tenuis]